MKRGSIYKLKGKIQHYNWGGFEYIPQLLGIENEDNKPYAEYWLGAHPNFPSTILIKGEEFSLFDFIQQASHDVLGEKVVQKFNQLPYLLKVLDVRQMLSIQVHPDKESAKKEFALENEKGISLTAPNRNYKDENHKPEMMIALSDFWLLHGFKEEEQLKTTLTSIPEFEPFVQAFESGGYEELFRLTMEMKQEEVNQILDPIVKRIVPLYQNNELLKSEESFWAARAVETFCKNEDYDRGIFSIYFFNLLQLKRGEGIFQGAGMPHAYLEGQNVELMANSDNVLRAGLTDKHIDVQELLKHVKFEATIPAILKDTESKEIFYPSPAEEFEIRKYSLKGEEVYFETTSAEIILVVSGSVTIDNEEEQLTLESGEAAFILAETKVFLKTNAHSEVYRASVPNV